MPVEGDVGKEPGADGGDEDDVQVGGGGAHGEVGGDEVEGAGGDEGEGDGVGTDHPLAVLGDVAVSGEEEGDDGA